MLFRSLLLETDGQGRQGSFLASEPAFQFLKSLQARDLVIPVVGNLAGTTAMPAIAAFLAKARVPLSAFYTSNVEFYLFREGSFPRFVDNVARLPRHPQSLIIRSVFGGAAATSPGYGSASVTQRTEDLVTGFAAGRFRRYPDLVSGS